MFEENVEEVRHLVLNTNRKLRMNEVEMFTETLTRIGRNAANLKTEFPVIQHELQKEIKNNMERILCEEKFIKDETAQIDQCLRRCKTLANMMVTMKKLAMVQDPSLNGLKIEKNNNRTLFTLNENDYAAIHHSNKFMQNDQMKNDRRTTVSKQQQQQQMIEEKITDHKTPPIVPPRPIYYEGNSKRNADANVLDTILDELTNTVQYDMRSKSKSPSSMRSLSSVRNDPPKPPERHSSTDVRNRYTTTEIQQMQRRAIGSVSPNPGNLQLMSVEFDERHEKLATKQRQMQLQQLCAPSNII